MNATMMAIDKIHEKKQPRRPHYLREWMDAKGLRAVDLSEELNLDKSLISRWLKGSTPTAENQKILASFFGCEPEGLFRHPDDDWLGRFLRDRPRDEIERIKQTLEAAFPRKAG
jgi:transcriptional regulator with XRE-family HTH domain